MKIDIRIYDEIGFATNLECYCGTEVYEMGKLEQGISPEVVCPVCGLTYVVEASIRYRYRVLRPSIHIRGPKQAYTKKHNTRRFRYYR